MSTHAVISVALIGFWGSAGPVRPAEPPAPLTALASMGKMDLPPGLRIELFAAEPNVMSPTALAFDPRGRAWIVEATSEPDDSRPAGRARGRIKICADTDGDGRADAYKVFAGGLDTPTGLVFGGGGVIVAAVPGLLLLRDTNGDDVADERSVLAGGNGRASLSNLRQGIDGWVWMTVGGNDGTLEVGEIVHDLKPGLIRVKPGMTALEVMTPTAQGVDGFGFNECGQAFAATADGKHIAYLAIPKRCHDLCGRTGTDVVGIADHAIDGAAAASGLCLYTARSLPEGYSDRTAFTCEPARHRVHIDRLEPRGTGFVAQDGGSLLSSDDPWTSPVAIQVGPDGAVWILDSYHEPAEGQDPSNAAKAPERGADHGRIYRIMSEAAAAAPAPRLDEAGTVELVAALGHENLWWRLTAQRLLVERSQPEFLTALFRQIKEDRQGRAALHALWALHGLGTMRGNLAAADEILRTAIRHPSPGVRRGAVEVMPRNRNAAAMIVRAELLFDPDPSVRLATLLALGEMPRSAQAAGQVASAMDAGWDLVDPWMEPAIVCAMAPSSLDFLYNAASSRPQPETRPRLLRLTRWLAELYARGAPRDTVDALITALRIADVEVATATVDGLLAGWPKGARPPSGSLSTGLLALFEKQPIAGKAATASLAIRWKVRGQFWDRFYALERSFVDRALNKSLSDQSRIEAVRQFVALGVGRESIVPLLVAASPDKASPTLTEGFLCALAQYSSPGLTEEFVYQWNSMRPTARRMAITLMLRRPDCTAKLMGALEQGSIKPAELSDELWEQLRTHPDASLSSRAKTFTARLGRRIGPDRGDR